MPTPRDELPGDLYAELVDALLSAFPGYGDLEQMVQFALRENLEALVERGPLRQVVFDLVKWAVARGQLRALVQAARETVPGNAALREVAAKITDERGTPHAPPAQTTMTPAETTRSSGGPAFVYGRPVERDQDLVGREEERARILDALTQAQPVELLGEPRMGRTSLLAWTERHAVGSRPIVRVSAARGMTAVEFVTSIAKVRGVPVNWSRRPTEHEAIDALGALLPMTLLVDDGDLLVEQNAGCSGAFFSVLRRHGQHGELQWVSVSGRPLQEVLSAREFGSDFLNDSQRVWVGALDEAARRTLAARSGAHADAVLAAAGGIACALQWLGKELSREGAEYTRVRDAFAVTMEPMFQRWWKRCGPDARRRLKACLSESVAIRGLTDRERRGYRALAWRGLVDERDEEFTMCGDAWRAFVQDV